MSNPEGIALNFAYALMMDTVNYDKVFVFKSHRISCINGHLVRIDFAPKCVYEGAYVSCYDRMHSKYDLFEEFKAICKEIEKENNSLFKEIRDYLKEDTECVLAYNRPKEEKRKYKTIARRKITLTELAFGKRKL